MITQFFRNFLVRLKNHIRRKVLLLIDKALDHSIKNVSHPNVEIIELSSNTMSKSQPLNADIIAVFKCQVQKSQLTYALDALNDERDPYKLISLLQCDGLFHSRLLSQAALQLC